MRAYDLREEALGPVVELALPEDLGRGGHRSLAWTGQHVIAGVSLSGDQPPRALIFDLDGGLVREVPDAAVVDYAVVPWSPTQFAAIANHGWVMLIDEAGDELRRANVLLPSDVNFAPDQLHAIDGIGIHYRIVDGSVGLDFVACN